MTRVGAVVLAAGQSSRFRAAGGRDPTKLVAKLDGKPIVRRVVETALATRARPVAVVTGYARESVEAAVADLEISVAFNPKFASGLASSLSVGLSAMPNEVAGALVLLGDMPWVEPLLIDALIDAFLTRKGALAAVPSREGRRGNPVLLGRGLFEAAMRLTGDEGARKLIDSLSANELVEVEALDAGVTFDVDTPDDLAAANLIVREQPNDDLKDIKKAVDEAAALSGAVWLSYVFALFYFAIAASTVTHVDMFFDKPVRLPFLGIDLPLLAFFFVAPALILVSHAYTLTHLALLADRIKAFNRALRHLSSANEDEQRRRISSSIFVQLLAGPADIRGGRVGWALSSIVWTTVVLAPAAVLLLLQLQFLPYHSYLITGWHRAALFLDFILLWLLWGKARGGSGEAKRRLIPTAVGLVLTFVVLAFSTAIATFPGEKQNDILGWAVLPEAGDAAVELKVSIHNWLLASPLGTRSRQRVFWFSDTLVLYGVNALESLGIQDPEKERWRDFIFHARDRNLRGAVFDWGSFPRVDFDGADLEGAYFFATQLDRSSFRGAKLNHSLFAFAKANGAMFDCLVQTRTTGCETPSELQRASFIRAEVVGATFEGSELQGSIFQQAKLQGTTFTGSWLSGADFMGAQLQGSTFKGAWLDGANLTGAALPGASFENAQLQATDFRGAQLEGVSLEGAKLQGASFAYTQLQGANFDRATLNAADLSDALLWRTSGEAMIVTAIRAPDDPDRWSPLRGGKGDRIAWDDRAYQDLKSEITSLPEGPLRNAALWRIERLDCANRALAPCDLAAIAEGSWRRRVEAARVPDATFEAALAEDLTNLVCPGNPNALFVLRGTGFGDRLRDAAAGPEGRMLIDYLLGKNPKACPISAQLAEPDKALLRDVKRRATGKP